MFHALIPCVAVGDVAKSTFNSQTVNVRHDTDAQVSLHHSVLMRVLTIHCINKPRGCDKVVDSERTLADAEEINYDSLNIIPRETSN